MRALVLLAALAVAAPAHAFRSPHGLSVTPNDGSDYTVNFRSRARLSDYWCAAGLYATRELGLPRRTRVFRLSPPPQGAGEGISFTLDSSRSAGMTGITTFGGPQDGSMSAGSAVSSFCYDLTLPDF